MRVTTRRCYGSVAISQLKCYVSGLVLLWLQVIFSSMVLLAFGDSLRFRSFIVICVGCRFRSGLLGIFSYLGSY